MSGWERAIEQWLHGRKQSWSRAWRNRGKYVLLGALAVGLLCHMPAMLSDIPNHDGLDSMYFDQNMVRSGRFFLIVACGLSGFYTLPWLIGVLALIWLGLAAWMLADFLELRRPASLFLCGAFLAAFPSMASGFAYVFTLDGYMLGLLLAVSAAFLAEKGGRRLWAAMLCLALSLGVYQAYISFVLLMGLYALARAAIQKGPRGGLVVAARFGLLGLGGAGMYWLLLQAMLALQGKDLDTYQGIQSAGSKGLGHLADPVFWRLVYGDFLGFFFHSGIAIPQVFALGAVALLLSLLLLLGHLRARGQRRPAALWVLCLLLCLSALPLAANGILAISPQLHYHMLMRHQYALFPLFALAVLEKDRADMQGLWLRILYGLGLVSLGIWLWSYVVLDNVAYGNWQKKYEKTYAYCLRLLDRIEQHPDYVAGMPIAMVGVVGEESYPLTDITGEHTAPMLGIQGDWLLYRGDNYREFMRHYLGASLHILPPEAMKEMYYDPRYRRMGSFPAEDSLQVIDGIMYIKTENRE